MRFAIRRWMIRLVLPVTLVSASAAGCGALQGIQVFTVSIVNDTAAPVVVRDCSDFCGSSPLVFNLQPGQSVPIHRTTNQHKYFSVTSPAGGHLGCVDLYFTSPQPDAEVPVSQARQCPGTSSIPWVAIVLGAAALLALSVFFLRSRVTE